MSVLGPLQVVDEQGQLVHVGGPRSRRMLALLLLHANELVTTDTMLEVLWPESGEAPSVNALQTQVSRLRQAVPGITIETVSPGYVLRAGPAELDMLRFEQIAAAATAALAARAWEQARELAGRALDCWRGEPLTEFAGERFVQGPAARLAELHLQVAECSVEARLALGDHRNLVADVGRLTDEHPYREQLWSHLMLALYRSGRQSEALRACSRLRSILVDELGIAPGPEVVRLENAMLHQDPALDWHPPAPSVPAAAEDEGSRFRGTHSLVGRDELVAEVSALSGRHRLVTLLGIGGVGKTSVARRVAECADNERFPDGIRFVELAVATSGQSLAEVILGELRSHRRTGESDLDAVVRALCSFRALLVLDNCEHVLGAVRHLAARLLAECPTVHLLATSREPLGLPGERRVPVPPLEVPSAGLAAEQLADFTAVRLFVERARAIDAGFTLTEENAEIVAEVTRYLGGVPLSLELAAARLDVEVVSELQTSGMAPLSRRLELMTRPDARTGSVWGSLQWSADLLEPPELAVFRSIGVFAGSFTREMAHRVFPMAEEFDRSFDRLVRASLLSRDVNTPNRFRLLEPVREFARSLLTSQERDRLDQEHRSLMMARARTLGRQLMTADEKAACDSMRVDLPDYRVVMAGLLDTGEVELAAELLVDLFQFCQFQLVPEGNLWASELARRLEDHMPLAAEVSGAAALGAWFEGNIDEAIRLGERSVGLAAAVGNGPPMWALLALVDSLAYAGRVDDLVPRFVALAASSRASPEPFWRINGLGYEAISWLVLGDRAAALVRSEEALRQARRLGNPDCLHWALHCHGRVLIDSDDVEGAAVAFEEAIAVTREVGSRWTLSLNLLEWARAKRRLGDVAAAAQAMHQLLGLLRESGNRSQLAAALGDVGRILADLGEAEAAAFALFARADLPDLRVEVGGGAVAEIDDEELLYRLSHSLGPAELAGLRIRAGGMPGYRVIALCRAALERVLILDPPVLIETATPDPRGGARRMPAAPEAARRPA
jgi:predicted ATPase/DNA-binding SARP family transcriptional activator